MTVNKDWHLEAIKLHRDGLSSRKIAAKLGKGKSSVNDLLVKWKLKTEESDVNAVSVLGQNKHLYGPKMLFLDIEVSSMALAGWRLFDQNFGLNQIEREWAVLSWCAKWGDSDEIFYMDKRDSTDLFDDTEILKPLWALMDEASYIVGQNSKRFDVKKLNAKYIEYGMPPPSPYRQIDTLEQCKRVFAFTSNKLEYTTGLLCEEYQKSQHGKFPAYELWRQCQLGNREAFEELEVYNKLDVLSLQLLYEKLCVWDNKLPNFAVHTDTVEDESSWVESGFVFSNNGKYQCYKNIHTGQYRRGKKNLLSKEKRESLLANIL